jgi:Asp/Glu/hydantoin racemase
MTRLVWQSFVDPEQNAPYLERLNEYLNEIARDGVSVDIRGVSPPDRWFGRLTELRCAAVAVDNALAAEDEGYDAFVLGHFQDSGLFEARSAVSIPVVGLGEASMHWAAQLGRLMALVSIDPVFTAWHWEQAERYGLRDRVAGVVGLEATVEDFAPAFAGDSDAYARLVEAFRREVEPLVEQGAEVIVPAGGLFGLLTARERGFRVGHAPVLNCVAVALKWAEAAVDLRNLTGLEPSRGPSFASPSPEAVAEYRAFVARGRSGAP